MLIVHPNSSCDVCLEHYGSGLKAPHSISCGHVFCLGCLDSITTGICPLCRDKFYSPGTRRLHIDIDGQGVAIPPRTSTADSFVEARRLQDSIARIVKDGSSEAHLRALIEECGTFLKTNRGQHEDLRVSFRMISYLCEVKSNLKRQTENLVQLEANHDALREKLTAELEAAERKYTDLLQTSADEKETALAVENSLREHYKQVLMRCEAAEGECERLLQLMDRRLQDSPLNDLGSVEDEICRRTDNIPFPTRDDMLNSMIKGTKIRNPEKDTLYLSPLPECIDHLPSSLKSFIALPEVEYDFEKTKDTEQSSNRQTVSHGPEPITPSKEAPQTPLEHHSRTHAFPLRSSTESISANPHAPKVSSGLSLTAPRDPSIHDQDTPMSSRQSSRRSSRHSSPSPFRPSPPTHSSVAIPDTYSRDRGRSFVLPQNGPEQLRSQLQDLLSNPVSSSLPNISHLPSSNVLPGHPSPPQSRSSSSTSPRPLPPPPHSSTFPPPVTSTPPIPPPHRSLSALTIQRPVISHASSAALALEKERQKAEKERREAAVYERHKVEQQQKQISATPSFNSLRDHTYFPTVQNSTTRREPSAYGGGSGAASNASSLSRGNSSSLRESSTGYATQHHRHQAPGNGKGRLASVQTLFT